MNHAAAPKRTPRWALGASLTIAAVGVVAVGFLGLEERTLPAIAWVLLTSGVPSAAYVAGAIGLGRIVLPLFVGRGSPREPALAAALGLGLMLSLSHGLGVLGLLSGGVGRGVAIACVAAGLAGLLLFRQDVVRRRGVDPASLLCIPPLVIAMLASCSPPGWLWDSEFGGYDALSYHLQLPQEWIAAGRISPVDHNVYSFLPSAVESAFVHVGALLGAAGPRGDGPWGLVENDGRGVLAAQLLHLGIGVVAVALLARLGTLAARRTSPASEASAAHVAACVAGVPWVIVTASLAYNEMGVLALGAGAALAAMDDRLSTLRRAVLAGALVGAACLCKPTALFFVGVPVGILLLGLAPPRRWPSMVIAGSFAGLFVLTPWLARNVIACGNPVFPFAAGLFGAGVWTPEQSSRFAMAHAFQGGWIERLGLLVGLADEPGDARRGLANLQWGAFALAPFVLPTAAWRRGGSRRISLVLSAGLVMQILAWLTTTHLQSRFLIPVLLTLAPLLGIVLRSEPDDRRARARWIAVLVVAAAGSACTLAVFGSQRGGRPGALIAPGPAIYSGEHLAAPPEEASPEAMLNLRYPGSRVFLLGDATPLYYSTPPIYSTTWDASALTRAIASSPDDPSAWVGALRTDGADLLLINVAELDRLRRSGWLDPSLTDERVRALGERLGPPVQSWPRSGRYLFDLSRSRP